MNHGKVLKEIIRSQYMQNLSSSGKDELRLQAAESSESYEEFAHFAAKFL